jgi:RNA polymerase sigma factor (sigma-70 family)
MLAMTIDADPSPQTALTPIEAQMVADNLGLISVIVKRGRLDYDDAYQDGVLGLMRASQKFDPAKGFKFSTYAMWWVRQSVNKGTTERSQHGARNQRRALDAGEEFDPLLSLDAPLGDEMAARGDLIAAPVDVENDALASTALEQLLARVHVVAHDDRDRQIISHLAFGDRPSLTTAAAEVGITREGVRQRVMRMRARLRHPVYRPVTKETPRMDEHVALVEPSMNGHHAVEPKGIACPECGQEFEKPQAVGVHRAKKHGYRRDPSAPSVTKPKPPAPRLDTKSVRESLDDYDPWVLVIGVVSDEGMQSESAVLASENEARQVARLFERIGHKSFVFRLAEAK